VQSGHAAIAEFFFWMLTAAVALALAVYLPFTVARWANYGAGLHLWNTTSVVHEV
jgi:hypothetical protein